MRTFPRPPPTCQKKLNHSGICHWERKILLMSAENCPASQLDEAAEGTKVTAQENLVSQYSKLQQEPLKSNSTDRDSFPLSCFIVQETFNPRLAEPKSMEINKQGFVPFLVFILLESLKAFTNGSHLGYETWLSWSLARHSASKVNQRSDRE